VVQFPEASTAAHGPSVPTLIVAAVPELGVSFNTTPVTWLGPLLYTVPEKFTKTSTTLLETCKLVVQFLVTLRVVLKLELHVRGAGSLVTVFDCVELPFGVVEELSAP
jgi:hypothetical protein